MGDVVNNIDVYRDNIVKICDQHIDGDYVLFLFGSLAARKNFYQSSDLDLAIYKEKKIAPALIVELKEDLEKYAGTLRDIDLINLTDEHLNPDLLVSILKEGVLWKKPKNIEDLLRNLRRRLENLKR